MRARVTFLGMSVLCLAAALAFSQEDKDKEKNVDNPVVLMKTSMGDITIELWSDKAPKTVENFLRYVDRKFYDDTICHRVIEDFMIQGGGFTKDLEKKKTDEPIKNEAKADVPNKRGTLAMARLGEPHSATAQFFINVKDNDFLNHRDDTPRGYGYCVFAEVTKGMDIVDKIRKVKTHTSGRYNDVPVELVVIESIRRVEKDQKAE